MPTYRTPYSPEDGKPDQYRHIVRKEDADMARRSDATIVAVCGKTWSPTEFGNDRPMCPVCGPLAEHDPKVNVDPRWRP